MNGSYFVPMRKGWILGGVVGVLLVVAGFLVAGGRADKPPSKVEETLANVVKRVVIPIMARNLANPLQPSDETVREGQELYLQACAICHGADGRAETDLGRTMYPPTIDLTSLHVQSWREAELFWIIRNGIRFTGMPASKFPEEDTWKVVHFLRSLPRQNASQTETTAAAPASPKIQEELIAYGRTAYQQEGCIACHRLNGEGGTLGTHLTFQGERGRTDEWLIGHFKNPRAYIKGSIMPPFKHLPDEQLRALGAFLQSQKED